MDRRTTKTTHYSLVALICVLIVTFALGMGGVATAGQDVAKTDAVSGFSKVGNFDMETLRQQYFSQTAVQETTASYSGKRWVIVELEGDSLFTSYENRGYWYGDFTTYCNSEEGKLLKADIEASHKDFLAVLDNNRIDYKYKYSYSTLNNGVALKVDADTFNEIKKLDGVKSVYYSESYSIPTVAVSNNANVYTTGIYDSSNLSYKGEGMVVAVLDTGLDYSHEAFATMPSNPAWTKEYVAAKMAASTRFNAQATVDEVYYNSKVPFAYDYADDDADVYPSYSTHGTHVAGIVAGKSDYVVNKETDETFVGVAPEAQLVICKVFTDNLDSDSLGGADTIDIIAAVSDCVELGVDVINMSLGSSAGFSDEKSDELINEVYNRVRAAGISLVVAASNDYSSGFGGGNGTNLASNPDSGTVGSPSTYGAALSVASINGQKATFIQANTAYDVAGAERGTFTAEGKDSIVFDGFGSATIGEKAYSYIINKKNVVVLKSDSETIGVTLDSEAKTYAIVTGDGFARSYIDAKSSKTSLVFDGFGGVLYTYASSYGSPTLSYGTYTLGTGTVTIKGANYNYNKTYSIEESGNVLASVDGKVVLAVAGYVVESKIDQFKGYWVNGSDTIEITLDSSNNASVSINGAAAIKAKANWNGSILTYTAADSDNSNSTWKTFDTEYTLKIVDGKLVVSHFCAVGIDEEPIYSDTATVVNYEAGSKAMDGVEGTYKKGSDVIVLDGQGNGTYTTGGKTYNFTYTVSGSTINVSNFYLYDDDENTFTVTSTGITVKCSGDYGNYSLEGDFTKQA